MFSDQQALKAAFARKDIHGRLARWLDFMAEYEFQVCYRKSSLNHAADFLCRTLHADQGVDGYDEEDLVKLVIDEKILQRMLEYFESELQEVALYLARAPLENETKSEKASICGKAVKFVLLQWQLFRGENHD